MPGVAQHVAGGRLRALAVTGGERSRFMPAVPTLAETIAPGFDTGTWFGLYGPRGLPRNVVQLLSNELDQFAADPAVRERLDLIACEQMHVSPETLDYAVRRQAEIVLDHYLSEIHALGAELSLSDSLTQTSDALKKLAARGGKKPSRRVVARTRR